MKNSPIIVKVRILLEHKKVSCIFHDLFSFDFIFDFDSDGALIRIKIELSDNTIITKQSRLSVSVLQISLQANMKIISLTLLHTKLIDLGSPLDDIDGSHHVQHRHA